MDSVLITNVRSGESGASSILIKKDRISECSSTANASNAATLLDGGESRLLPGFIDIHIHGAIGRDVNASTAEELLEVAAFLAGNGVTAWVPTLVPDSDENYARIIGEIDRLMELQEGKAVAQAHGVHYEGVFASEAMCGALRPQFFKSGQWLIDGGQLPKLKNGVHMTTLAPEVEDGIELIKKLVDDGWIVSIGHTRADPRMLDAAFEAGAKHMTHFFNAMTGIHHRDIGVAGWGLAKSDVSFDIIADGIHVSSSMLKLACETKGVDRVSLISDSVAPTGLGDGRFELWGEEISVIRGRTQNERGSIAGSVITMNDAVKQMLKLGFSVDDVSKMASTNPATLLGVDGEVGSIEVGKRADLVGLDDEGNIKFVMIGGIEVV
jgi:N-acetylglucosamine-6-phosphate deacetylase